MGHTMSSNKCIICILLFNINIFSCVNYNEQLIIDWKISDYQYQYIDGSSQIFVNITFVAKNNTVNDIWLLNTNMITIWQREINRYYLNTLEKEYSFSFDNEWTGTPYFPTTHLESYIVPSKSNNTGNFILEFKIPEENIGIEILKIKFNYYVFSINISEKETCSWYEFVFNNFCKIEICELIISENDHTKSVVTRNVKKLPEVSYPSN